MSDEIDRANDLAATMAQARENEIRAAAQTPEAQETGACLNCGEPTGPGRRWCDADCRDDWQVNQKRSR